MQPKFRAWDTKQNKMWSAEEMGQDQLTLSPDGRGFINVSGTSTKLSRYLPHLIPLQSTGLLDKNGKEIYESDIVLLPTPSSRALTKARIIWDEEIAGFCLEGFGENSDWHCDYYRKILILRKFEVIGNIHENPELLEE